MKPRILIACAAALAGLATSAEAQFSCSTVARIGQVDPDGQFYSNAFRDEVAVNASGDTLFAARAIGARDKLYFYPAAGAGQVVARANDPAPSGGTFQSRRPFSFLSVNGAQNVGFFAALVSGEGVFVRDAGTVETGALRSQASPAGGVFRTFPYVGDIDAASRVPFVAAVDGGPGGVFVYDAVANALSVLVLDGAATIDGRELCANQTVDLGAPGFATVRASSKVSCANVSETPLIGVFLVDGGTISTIALEGDAAPIGGSTFSTFIAAPRINASNQVGFRATTAGTTRADGIFVWDFATDTIATAVRKGDAAPVVGGSFAATRTFRIADSGDVVVNASLRTSAAKFGVFGIGAVDGPILVKTDAPPTDAFGAAASYVRFSKQSGASHDGLQIGVQVRVRDSSPPIAKNGVVRCAGSPSGAFLDDEPPFL